MPRPSRCSKHGLERDNICVFRAVVVPMGLRMLLLVHVLLVQPGFAGMVLDKAERAGRILEQKEKNR